MPGNLRLVVVTGPDPGLEILLEPLPGLRLAIGRSPDCTVTIDHETLSRRHFEIFWDGEQFRLADLGSSNGTLLNGEPVAEAALSGGEQIQAGDIAFRIDPADAPAPALVPFEQRRVPPPPEPPVMAPILSREKTESPVAPEIFRAPGPADPIAILGAVETVFPAEMSAAPDAESLVARLIGAVGNGDGLPTYAIVNAAENFELAVTARLMGHNVYTLLAGGAADIAVAAPTLVAIGQVTGYLDLWVEHIGSNGGLLIQSDAGPGAVHHHLRDLCIVVDQQNQEFILNYHDPRVFRTEVPTYGGEALQALFGPVRRWFCENADADGFVMYELAGGQLHTADI